MDGFQPNENPIQPVPNDQKGSQTTLNPLGISCDNCRIWKTKCVRGQQECVRCRKRGVSCTYSGTGKKPKDMDQIFEVLDGLKSRIDGMDQTLSQIQKKLDSPQTQSLSTDQDALDETFMTRSTNSSSTTSLSNSTKSFINSDPFQSYCNPAGLLHNDNSSNTQRTVTNCTSTSENVFPRPDTRTCTYYNNAGMTGVGGSLGVDYEALYSTNLQLQGLTHSNYDFEPDPSANGSSGVYYSVV